MRKYLLLFFILLSSFSLCAGNRIYEGTYLMEETDEEGNTVHYTYLDGRLLFSTLTDNAGTVSVEYYLRDPATYSLIAVKRDNGLSMSSGGSFVFSEDGQITYTNADTVYTYSVSGLLLSMENSSTQVYYEYDDNSILSSRTIKEGSSLKTEKYVKGKISSYEKFENSVIAESGVYSDSGLIKTIYSRGKAAALVRYGSDLIKVMSIEYL